MVKKQIICKHKLKIGTDADLNLFLIKIYRLKEKMKTVAIMIGIVRISAKTFTRLIFSILEE